MARLMTRTVFTRALAVVAAAAAGAAAFAVRPSLADLALFGAVTAGYVAPGWPLARWVAGDSAGRLTRAILAVPLGYLAGATLYCALRLSGVVSPWIILAASLALAFLLSRLARGEAPGIVAIVPFERRDVAGLAVLSLAALAVAGPVFARVGEATPAGLAYRAYFNADLFVHMSVVAELAKGASPPVNPYYAAEALPYYWTYFTLPALFSQIRSTLPVDPGILLTNLVTSLAFVSTAFLVSRNLGASTWAAVWAWLLVLLASSFEGAWFLWRQLSRDLPVSEFLITNMDAVTRWYWNLPGVDGLHRAMWWTPQHLMALTLVLILLLAIARARPNRWAPGLIEGLLLGGLFVMSTFNGVLLTLWYALFQIVRTAHPTTAGGSAWIRHRATAAAIVTGYLGLALATGIIQMIPGSFILGWNRYFLRAPWTFYALSFGPALLLAPLGIAAAWKASRILVAALAVLAVVITAAFLFVDLRGHENTQVTFRTGHLLFLVLGLLVALAFRDWRHRPAPIRVGLAGLTLVLTIAAVPTVALDWYNARDISNVEMNPGGFPWTVHVSPDDQAAIRWIHAAIPEAATIQVDAGPRDRYTWAFVPAFARRRMAVGNGIFLLNPGRHAEAFRRIHAAFEGPSAEEAHRTFRDIGADYVYVGDVERRAAAAGIAKFPARPDLFQLVYRRGSVEIFKLVR